MTLIPTDYQFSESGIYWYKLTMSAQRYFWFYCCNSYCDGGGGDGWGGVILTNGASKKFKRIYLFY